MKTSCSKPKRSVRLSLSLFLSHSLTPPSQHPHLISHPPKQTGVKLSFTPLLAHHTHLLTARAIPTSSLLLASMSLLPILTPTYFTALYTLLTPPPYPSPPPIADPPQPSSSDEDPKLSEKRMNAWEKQLLGLNPEVGFDWKRWWGHSAAEEDWERRPDEGDLKWRPKKPSEVELMRFGEVEKWGKDEERRRLFEGVVVVSYRGMKEAVSFDAFGANGGFSSLADAAFRSVPPLSTPLYHLLSSTLHPHCPPHPSLRTKQDEPDSRLLQLGSGHFLASHLLTTPEVTFGALIDEIEDFKKSQGIAEKQVRIVLLAPSGVEEEVKEGEGEGVKLLREVAKA